MKSNPSEPIYRQFFTQGALPNVDLSWIDSEDLSWVDKLSEEDDERYSKDFLITTNFKLTKE